MKNQNETSKNTAETALKQYMDYWEAQRGLPTDTLDVILESLQNQGEFQEFARFEKSIKVVFDQTNFRIVHLTDNATDLLGYTSEDFISENINLFFKLIDPTHLDFAIKATQFSFDAKNKIGIEAYSKNTILFVCGIKAIKKDGSLCRLLMKYRSLVFDAQAVVQTALITFEDVTFLMKSDFYWSILSCGDNKEHRFHFVSNVEKDIKNDIISDREKDVLRLLAKGMESKEIGNQLFISSGTVDNHRKNMIARTGARDTTALLQLCLSCGII